jgi:hypothetical protein
MTYYGKEREVSYGYDIWRPVATDPIGNTFSLDKKLNNFEIIQNFQVMHVVDIMCSESWLLSFTH